MRTYRHTVCPPVVPERAAVAWTSVEGFSVNGEEHDSKDRSNEWRRQAWAELLDLFGPVRGPDSNADMAAVAEAPPWRPVDAGEAADLVVAYVKTDKQVRELRDALLANGFSDGEFPELCVAVDEDGWPVIRVGRRSGRA